MKDRRGNIEQGQADEKRHELPVVHEILLMPGRPLEHDWVLDTLVLNP